MCNHVFCFSTKSEKLVVSHSSKKRRIQLKDNGQLQNVLVFRDENDFLDRNSNAGVFCPLICRMLRNLRA